MIAQCPCDREAGLLLKVMNDQGFLVLPYPARDRAFYGDLRRRLPQRGFTRLEHLQSHHVARSIVQKYAEVLKVEEAFQTASEIVKQVKNVAMRRDRF